VRPNERDRELSLRRERSTIQRIKPSAQGTHVTMRPMEQKSCGGLGQLDTSETRVGLQSNNQIIIRQVPYVVNDGPGST